MCFHGEPTWAYLYRKMLPPAHGRGPAGRSAPTSRASAARTSRPTAAGTPTTATSSTCAACSAALDLRDATVVVQDWGGPIGLRWAVENADRVARLVILNTGLFTGRVSKGFMSWRDFAERNPDLPVGFVIQSATTTELPGRDRGRLRGALPRRPSRRPARRAVPAAGADRRRPAGRGRMRAVADELSRWDKPALVAFSDSDPVFPYPRAGECFCDLIPGAGEQVTIEGAAHFLQEDRGEQIAEEIVRFTTG